MPTRAERLASRRRRLPSGRRLPVQSFPEGLERAYVRTLEGLVLEMTRAVAAALADAMGPAPRTDADEPRPRVFARVQLPDVELDEARASRIRTAIHRVELDFSAKLTDVKARTLARGVGRETAAVVEGNVDRQLQGLVPMSALRTNQRGVTQPLVEQWARENVALIKTVPARYFDQIREVVIDSVNKGRRAGDLEALVEERGAVAGYNARRIARDQISKLNGRVTEARQRALGVSRYVWRTSRDERVRSSHADLEGQVFSWSDPPEVGHPGEDIQCRCRAEPVIDDVLDGL